MDSPAGPALSRRRELGDTSARSLLMTVLGEFVLPREEAAWTSTLVGARQEEALSILDRLALSLGAMSFTAHYGTIGQQQDMVTAAWDLGGVAARYEQFIAEFSELRTCSGDEVLRAQIRLVHEWRRFPFLDPQLPPELLPPRWSGIRAAALFHHKYLQWRPVARRRWDELLATDS